MNTFNYFLIIFTLINLLIVFSFNKLFFLHYILDKPDKKRKLHLKPIPLAGGIILIINIIIYFITIILNEKFLLNEIFFNNYFELYVFILSALSIFFVGFFDDKNDLSPNHKFLILLSIILITMIFDQNLVISSINFSFVDEVIYLGKYSLFFTCFCFLVFLNAFNMFDGINVQVSFYSIIIFCFMLFFLIDSYLVKIILIFLLFYSYLNYKNKSFLGDSGSLLLAFLISYTFIKLHNYGQIKFADEIFIFMMLPGLDLIRVFFKRILNNKNPLRPDRTHLHHMLIFKFTHMLSLIIIQLFIIVPIILLYLDIDRLFIIVGTILCYLMMVYKLDK
tara:strand:- start:3994 stop:4998 length:1005 start_codon:yes stop_codon:yes gene_type:complete